MTPDLAQKFAMVALGHVTREYPHKLDHVLLDDADALPPRMLHPIFFGSFDWHSCVHGYWLLLRLLRTVPGLPAGADIATLADEMLVPDKVAVERAYLDRPLSGPFERPYGWAWALALHGEAMLHEGRGWGDALDPLARAFAARFADFLPRQTYPIRTGTHYNSAFALTLALDWAEVHDAPLATLIRDQAVAYYGADRDCPAWEPGGDEFLSAAMIEALLMRRVLGDGFGDWLGAFLPRLDAGEPAALFTPAYVSDRSDGKIAHLDGFNLARAWCWRGIADALPGTLLGKALETAQAHLDASLPHVAGDYMGEHWLATFALLAMGGQPSGSAISEICRP